jgi:hypothetical protein
VSAFDSHRPNRSRIKLGRQDPSFRKVRLVLLIVSTLSIVWLLTSVGLVALADTTKPTVRAVLYTVLDAFKFSAGALVGLAARTSSPRD